MKLPDNMQVSETSLKQCLSFVIDNLKNVSINENNRYGIDSIRSAYRRVFGREYGGRHTNDLGTVILKDTSKLHPFLNSHHCCWIDFIACDSFTEDKKNQVFFSTVSMGSGSSDRRKKFIKKYLEELDKGVPVDIFVQLFFEDFRNIEERLKRSLDEIQSKGLVISSASFSDKSVGICSTVINCDKVDSIDYNAMQYRTVAVEAEQFLKQLNDPSDKKEWSDLVTTVAKLNLSLHEGVEYIYFIPVNGPDGSIGLVCYGSSEEMDEYERADISVLSYTIMFPFVAALKSSWEKQQLLRQTVIASLSRVMSRNMSHNYGSHVLTALSSSRAKTFDISGGPYMGMDFGDGYTVFTREEQDIYHQVSGFNSHIRNRMDYISDISYGTPMSLSTMDFADDILREFDRCRLMLNYISGLGANFQYEIQVRGENGISVAVPDDVIGCQAFFNILENIIRNAAKHSNISSGVKNVFTVEYKECENNDGLIEVLVYHNKEYLEKEIEKILKEINGWIGRDIIDDNGLRAQGLGIIEMTASAAFLRQLNPASVFLSESNYEPAVLEAVKVPQENGSSFLGYKFYMLVPREVLIVRKNNDFPFTRNSGIWNISSKDLRARLQNGEVFNHSFIVFEDGALCTDANDTALPVRALTMADFPESEDLDKLTVDDCWKAWGKYKSDEWEITNILGSVPVDYPEKIPNAALILSHSGIAIDDKSGLTEMEGIAFPERLCDPVNKKGYQAVKYCEGLSSHAQRKMPDFPKYKDLNRYRKGIKASKQESGPLYYKNLEVFNTKVFVIDERVQKQSMLKGNDNIELFRTFELAGMPVLSPNEVNLEATDFGTALCERLLSAIRNRLDIFDFIVIHYGLLERVFKSLCAEKWHDELIKYSQTLCGHRARIVIDSGRGIPKGLPTTFRFVSLSSVTNAMLEIKSKALLTGLLYSSRKAKI